MKPVLIDKIPIEAGCLSILRHVDAGKAVQIIPLSGSEVPAALQDCKWPDVRTWTVLLWENGEVYSALLKTEMPEPWSLENLRVHRTTHPHVWRLVSMTHNPGKN